MSKTSVQYQLLSKGASFTAISIPHPVPGPNEISIRSKAVALNPLDWKSRNFGVMISSWPGVIGCDAAGIIDSVGESVKGFKVGDEVITYCNQGTKSGAFQEIVTVPEHWVSKKPASLTFEDAASLPCCYLTASAAITVGLKIPLPNLEASGSSSVKSILVLGGSSGVGAGAIQLLRLALPSAIILTTSSAKHHARLLSLGATKCYERSAQDDESAFNAATPDGLGVDAILDTVQAAGSQPAVFKSLNPTGPKLYAQVMTGSNVEVPEGIQSNIVYLQQIFGATGGTKAMPSLASLLESGKFKLPTDIEIVGNGFASLGEGLDKLMKGVSGTKYVLTV